METNEVNSKILAFLKIRGPCLPVHISKHLQTSLIFAGAFLSELAGEKSLKISNMKVGGSPLYYLPGQEWMLDNFFNYLPGKEKETFLLLKNKGILKDTEQEPAVRFALRQIKDFSVPLQQDDLFWRFHSVSEQEALEKIKVIKKTEKEKQEKVEEKKVEVKKEKIEEKKIIVPEKKEVEKKVEEKKPVEEKKEKQEKLEEKPLIKLKKTVEKKVKEKSWFVLAVQEFLKRENIEILQEIEYKKKEYIAKVRINSDLGKIEFLCIAKDKKAITQSDLTLALKNAQDYKLSALIVSKADLNKKAQKYIEEWSNMIKFKKMSNV